jgi:hypothetical protein
MMNPHFLPLAKLDDQHFIAACRHGIVHLTWDRVTVRYRKEEFQRLAGLLDRVRESQPPISLRDGEMRVTSRINEDCELKIGSLVLLLPPSQFEDFCRIAVEAVERLEDLQTSGAWHRDEPDEAPADFTEQFRQNPFSSN